MITFVAVLSAWNFLLLITVSAVLYKYYDLLKGSFQVLHYQLEQMEKEGDQQCQ